MNDREEAQAALQMTAREVVASLRTLSVLVEEVSNPTRIKDVLEVQAARLHEALADAISSDEKAKDAT
jgi:hypothetical protein